MDLMEDEVRNTPHHAGGGGVPTDFLLKQTPLSRISEEFGVIEYQLQLALRSPSCEIENVWIISNPHVTMQFEKRTQSMLTLDSWIETSRLSEYNSVPDLCQRGFKFPVTGSLFPVGSIHIRQPRLPPGQHPLKGKRTFEFVLCRVGVGRSYCLEDASVIQTGRPVVPEGYDTLYLHKSDEQLKEESKGRAGGYYHEYLMLDPAQVLPAYLVQFKYDPEDDEQKKIPLCDVCEENAATLYCRQDSARLCAICDEEVHSANKLVSKHLRVPVYEQPQSYGTCPVHPQLTVEFFCPVCQGPVCVHCKMVGNHSTGEAASHKLIPIGDAYRTALQASEKDDPLLDGRRQAVMTQLSIIDERLKEVNRNSGEIEERIYQLLREALFQLQTETQKKLGILLGDELELRRQLEQMEWLENFLRFQVQVLPPVKFLSAWSRHSRLRGEWLASQHVRGQVDVFPDIRLRAMVEVATEEMIRQREMETQDDAWAQEEYSRAYASPARTKAPAPAGSPHPLHMGAISHSSMATPTGAMSMAGSGMVTNPGLSRSAGVGPGVGAGGAQPMQEDTHNYTAKRTADVWRDELRKRHLASTSDNDSHAHKNEFSLVEEANKKQFQLQQIGVNPLSLNPFHNSRILSPDQANTLYFNLPFTNTPGTRLMFSTYQDGSSVTLLHQKCDSVGPTVVIARSADHVFGGYASTSWNASKIPFGTAKSFLFSITKDTKVAFTGSRDTTILFGTPSSISWGHIDLVFKDDLKSCTSELENSYGLGFSYQSQDAGVFLAGDRIFDVNCLEVWAFTK